MTLRTPRRRISPRTRRRYRAIREFFRRALGSSSQPDIKISSSIAVNVTDLKRKIVGLEQQLDEVNKHCQDIACLDCSRRESERSYFQSEVKHEIGTIKEQTEVSSERKLNDSETQLLYRTSECTFKKFSDQHSDCAPDTHDVNQNQDMNKENYDDDGQVSKVKNKKSKLDRITDYGAKLHKYRASAIYDNFTTAYSTSSFRSLTHPRMKTFDADYPPQPKERKYHKQEHGDAIPSHPHKEKRRREHVKRNKIERFKDTYEQKPNKIHKHKRSHGRELDQDFIADIIRRQYKPVKMFGRKESELSQFSAPVCRDQEHSYREDIQEGTELCSCCYDKNHHRTRQNDFNEMRSICDTRLYSSKKYSRGKHRRMHVDMFNNSELYDLVPVKEKSSPKTRRKFTEDNLIPYESYREVPPSPRTLRPRLNLKAQYNTEFEEYMAHVNHSYRRGSPHKHRRQRERHETYESDVTGDPLYNKIKEKPQKSHNHIKCQVEVEKQEQCHQETGTMSSLQYPDYQNEPENVTVDTTFNKTQEVEKNVDKTDKALCEIKDILQHFLHEIKKETIVTPCDNKSDVTSKSDDHGSNSIHEKGAQMNGNINLQQSRHSFNNYSLGQCNVPPFVSPLTNPYCYPILPICPMNCPMSMQNGFLMPNQSYTCTNCANVAKESVHTEHCCSKNINATGTCHAEPCHTETCHTETCHTETCHAETEELIKEIYKFVAQSPVRKNDSARSTVRHESKKTEPRMLTSRSVGASSKLSKHDAKVGTAPMKCYSKSCEAIGPRSSSEPYYSGTNASYSDTILEKLSLEVTQSTEETEIYTTESTEEKEPKPNKFSRVLRSIGLLKKKKKDVIEELSESESMVNVEVKPKAPFEQEMTNYMMHGQEYYRPPPIPQNYRPNEYQPDYNPPYNPGVPEYPPHSPPPMHDIYAPRTHNPRMREHATAPPYHSKQRPTAPPYHSCYDYNQIPQVPLCLKEIEVKSIGTQSERKMSIFRKFKKKIQPPMPLVGGGDYQKNCSTQTQTAPGPSKLAQPLNKPLFNWKSFQAKAMQNPNLNISNDPVAFTRTAQKDLAQGDFKLRKAMVKKLFYKRNPFSPRNLIVRTLLGKDKSSYGEPPAIFRPRMFF